MAVAVQSLGILLVAVVAQLAASLLDATV